MLVIPTKPILIKDIEKQFKIKFDVNPRMKLSTYLKKSGLPSLAKVLNRIEKTPLILVDKNDDIL